MHTAEERPDRKAVMDLNSTSSSPIVCDQLEEFNRFVTVSASEGSKAKEPQSLKAWLDLAETYRITQALRQCRGNRSAAARLLGIGRRTLYAKMDKLGLGTSHKAS